MISIIVPLYNEGEAPGRLVAHLLGLEGLEEVILVDSSDDPLSRQKVGGLQAACPERLSILQGSERGRAVQMNLGASRADGGILLFLHCDSRLPANALSLVERAIDSGHEWGRFDIRLDARGKVYRLIETMINLRSRFRQIATGDQGIFVKAELFRECGGYPAIALMEDIALSNLLKRRSRPCLIKTPLLTSARRWHNRGIIPTVLLMWRLRFLYWCGASPEKLYRLYGEER